LSKNSTWEPSALGPVKRNLFIVKVLLLFMVAKEATFVEQEKKCLMRCQVRWVEIE